MNADAVNIKVSPSLCFKYSNVFFLQMIISYELSERPSEC